MINKLVGFSSVIKQNEPKLLVNLDVCVCLQLLTRVFDIMREKNPDMIAGEKKKFVMRPPQVLRVGTRKSSFANFAEICRLYVLI